MGVRRLIVYPGKRPYSHVSDRDPWTDSLGFTDLGTEDRAETLAEVKTLIQELHEEHPESSTTSPSRHRNTDGNCAMRSSLSEGRSVRDTVPTTRMSCATYFSPRLRRTGT